MNGREIEKRAWEDFSKWCDEWYYEHPNDDIDTYTLALMYPDRKLIDLKKE